MRDKNRILIAFDGSEQVMNAVDYVSRFFPPNQTNVTLFHVAIDVPEAFLDLHREPGFGRHISGVNAWVLEIKKKFESTMMKARARLMEAGFPAEQVRLDYHRRKTGIARDIIEESRKNYDLLVIGREGISKLKDVVIGSVANKIVSSVRDVPVVVVGGKPEAGRILVGFDGSDGAMKAIDCICAMMAGSNRSVTLCHIVRSLNIFLGVENIFKPEEEQWWLAETRAAIEPSFAEAEKKLIDAGFHPSMVFKEILENKLTRAGGIVKAARDGECGTIVVGRRGLTVVEEFIMGRVSRKVLHMADDMATWIV